MVFPKFPKISPSKNFPLYGKTNTSDAELDDTADFGADVDLDANVDIEI